MVELDVLNGSPAKCTFKIKKNENGYTSFWVTADHNGPEGNNTTLVTRVTWKNHKRQMKKLCLGGCGV